ncbi:MAG: hypothetical protein ACRDZY_18580, partial [Acidimicrobiales bacterium]
MTASFAPPPADVGDGGPPAVTVDVEAVHARLTFDVAVRQAHGTATIDFRVEGPDGRPALDLRQPVAGLRLDGRPLPGDAFPHRDLGGGPGSEMRVLDVPLTTGGRHRLDIDYRVETPDATGAEPVGWRDGGVRFDLWMSDLEPGRYLEMWVPAPLVHDRFALEIDLEVTGTDREHVVVANGDVTGGATSFRIRYPPHFTALSPMLVVAPSDEVTDRRGMVALAGRAAPLVLRCAAHRELEVDLAACEADVASWLAYLAARYGP